MSDGSSSPSTAGAAGAAAAGGVLERSPDLGTLAEALPAAPAGAMTTPAEAVLVLDYGGQ
ncbi:MAG: hypothetical protein QOI03_761 [Solirubrobacteraceae bacterium]|jgi:hypothetical protein|nr:hypothetical protein [Solirubrobacteraceae bacterium]